MFLKGFLQLKILLRPLCRLTLSTTGTFKMNAYLSECKSLAETGKPLCIVMGNESCDLDSAICSICLAMFLSKNVEHLANKAKKYPIVPILNITRAEVPLKTDVNYFLKENQIDVNNLICFDEVHSDTLELSDFILVDHHVSKYSQRAIQVIDHRPIDPQSRIPDTCCQTIEEVGSCATLIADYIIKSDPEFDRSNMPEIARLLYGPIVLDTFNFSAEAGRGKPLDFMMAEQIERIVDITIGERNDLFRNLFNARFDVSALDTLQILMKDLKIVSNSSGSKRVAISSCTILCQNFLKRSKAEENILKFWQQYKCDVLLILGLEFNDEFLSRDFGLINFTDKPLFESIYAALSGDDLCGVIDIPECTLADGKYAKHNERVTRKHILPIVKRCLQNF